MKAKVFIDDGLPESWDCNDNYCDLSQVEAQVHIFRWKRDTESCHSKPAASATSMTETPGCNVETGFKTQRELGV